MLKHSTVLLLITLSAVAPARADEAAQLFDSQRLHTLHLIVSPAAWDQVQPPANDFGPAPGPRQGPGGPPPPPNQPNTFTYVHADLELAGQTVKDIGLRFKGNSSFRSSAGSLKRPMKVDFNHFVQGQKFLGLGSLHLNINAMDPSGMREFLAYSIFRQAGIPCARTAWAKVYLTVPGRFDRQYLGLYILIEDVGKTFVKDRFASSQGILVKPDRLGNLPYLGEQWTVYKDRYSAKTEGTPALQQRFIEFIKLVQNANEATFRQQIDSYLDVDQFLRFIAINTLLSNMDSFLCTGHNFCLYLDPATKKITWIPWDLNEAFAGFMSAGSPEEQINLSIDHPYVGNNRLLERILAIPPYKQAYRQHLSQLLATTVKAEPLLATLAATQKLVADAMAQEQKAGISRPGNRGGFPGPMGGGPGRQPFQKVALDVFIKRRIESVAAQLTGRSQGQVLRSQQPFRGGPPDRNFGGGGAFLRILRAADANGDGRLSKNELQAEFQRLINEADHNQDGFIDEPEFLEIIGQFLPFAPQGGPRNGPPPGPFWPPPRPDNTETR